MKNVCLLGAGAAMMLCSSAAFADFSGQTIFGPIGPGASVSGNTIGASDDNDGFFSGGPIFFIWDGGDDVWSLNWPGGDLQVDLLYNNQQCDVDLFVYSPDSLDETGDYGIANSGVDTVIIPGAVAGKYFIVIDSTAGTEGAYQLNIGNVPAPGGVAFGAIALAGLARRRR